MCRNDLNLPTPRPLPGSDIEIPYVFLGDGAFALSEYIMKPYPGNYDMGSPKRKFNQTLSRARVVVENTFGILVTKFRVFKKPIQLQPEKAAIVTMTCILLHNFLRRSSTSLYVYTPHGTIDIYDNSDMLVQPGSWRQEVEMTCAVRDLRHVPRRPPLNATEIRNQFTNYFSR
ncbi:hypothetical protein HF086_005615 [Spodoptera exigua]|uniref:DDE Tnp4 domain-containing protein n=1 Tax=Spodoptera exigua TaxID=7107 RepID=A0A922MXG9_SPOEX|nr:hypothetical protein HF086_005615 [Spodoptera exigua]